MFAEKHYPEMMLPEELDTYLSKGWYRMGQTIFTTHFLCFSDQFFSAIWVRLPLQNYVFRKSLRKLLRRNKAQFHIEIRKAYLNFEKEQLFRRYRANFPGILAPSLRDSMMDGDDFNIFDTYEVAVYDKNQLVACSFFDMGKASAASIMGIYDPNYQQYSLGFFTMLIEIGFCMDLKIPYYYPGYVVPGYSRFDYKLRIGQVEYFNLYNREWENFEALQSKDIPIEKMRNQLQLLHFLLKKNAIASKLLYYPLFEANLFGFWNAPYFDYPILLWCFPKSFENQFYIVVYDVRDQLFKVLLCVPFDDLQFYFNESYTHSFDEKHFFMELIIVEQVLGTNNLADPIIKMLRELPNQRATGGVV